MGKWKKYLLMTNCSSLLCVGRILNVIARCFKSFYKKGETKMTDTELVKKWQTISTEFEATERMSCVPAGIKKVRADHIFDEEKSVRWNREMAEKNNADYQAEVARLNTEKNKRRDAILDDIYRLIQKDVGHGLSQVKAQRLWAYAWEQGRANGFSEVYYYLQDLIELARMLLSKDRE